MAPGSVENNRAERNDEHIAGIDRDMAQNAHGN